MGVMELYNKILGGKLPKVIAMTPSRKQKLRSRDLSIEQWQNIFEKVSQTPFLLGENSRGWTCSLDWLLANDTNYVKVLEGRYDGVVKKNAFHNYKDTEEKMSEEELERMLVKNRMAR